MILLYCKNCGDVYNLKGSGHKTCDCGATGGIEENNGTATLNGDPFVLKLNEEQLSDAVLNQIQRQMETPQTVGLNLVSTNNADFNIQ